MKEQNLSEEFIKKQEDGLAIAKLETETGITSKEIEKIKKNPSLMRAFKILLLTVGLTLGIVEGAAQQIGDNSKQIDGQEQVDNGFEEKMKLVKKEFINLVKRLQQDSVVVYENRREMGIESSADGQVGKYKIQALFHHYKYGQKEGEITGQNNERIVLSFAAENGADYYIESFFGKFSAYAMSYTPQPGFEEKDKQFMFNKGIIIGRRGVDKVYYKELSPEETTKIIKDIEKKAGMN